MRYEGSFSGLCFVLPVVSLDHAPVALSMEEASREREKLWFITMKEEGFTIIFGDKGIVMKMVHLHHVEGGSLLE